jgi:hypothetical protein
MFRAGNTDLRRSGKAQGAGADVNFAGFDLEEINSRRRQLYPAVSSDHRRTPAL